MNNEIEFTVGIGTDFIISDDEMERAIEEFNKRAPVFGESYAGDETKIATDLPNIAVVVNKLIYKDGVLTGVGRVLDTPAGKQIRDRVTGVLVSTGIVNVDKEVSDYTILRVDAENE